MAEQANIGVGITIQGLEGLEKGYAKATELSNKMSGLFETVTNPNFKLDLGNKALEQATKLNEKLGLTKDIMKQIHDGAQNASNPFGGLNDKADALNYKFKNTNEIMGNLTNKIKDTANDTKVLAENSNHNNENMKQAIGILAQIANDMRKNNDLQRQQTVLSKETGSSLKDIVGINERIYTGQGRQTEAIKTTNVQLGNARLKLNDIATGQQLVISKIDEASNATGRWSNKAGELKSKLDVRGTLDRDTEGASHFGSKLDSIADKADKTSHIFGKMLGANLISNGITNAFTSITSHISEAKQAVSEYNDKQQTMSATWDTLTGNAKKGQGMVDVGNNLSKAYGQNIEVVDELNQKFYHVFNNKGQTEQLTKSVLTLGDTLGMSDANVQRLGENFTHMMTSGKMQMGDFNHISDQLPMFGEKLLEQQKKMQHNSSLTMQELQKQMSAGKISAKDAEEVMNELGGKYQKASENLMKTLPGMRRMVKSQSKALANEIYSPIANMKNPIFEGISKWVQSDKTTSEFKKVGNNIATQITRVTKAFDIKSVNVTGGLDKMMDSLNKGVTQLGNFIVKNKDSIKDFFSVVKEGSGGSLKVFAATLQMLAPILKITAEAAAKHPKIFAAVALSMLAAGKATRTFVGAIEGIRALKDATGLVKNFAAAGKGTSKVGKAMTSVADTVKIKSMYMKDNLVKAGGAFKTFTSNTKQKLVELASTSKAKFSSLVNSSKQAASKVGQSMVSIGKSAKAGATKFASSMVTMAKSAAKSAVGVEKSMGTMALSVVKSMGRMAIAFATNPFGIAILAITAIGVGLVELYKHFKPFRDFVNGIGSFVKKAFGGIIDFFKNNWKTIGLFILNPFAGISKMLYDHVKPFHNFVDTVGGVIKKGFEGFVKFIKNPLKTAGSAFDDLKSKSVKTFDDMGKKAGNIGKSIGDSFKNAPKNVQTHMDALRKGVFNTFDYLQKNSPKQLDGMWKTINGITKDKAKVNADLTKVGADLMHGHWSNLGKDMNKTTTDMWNGIKNAFKSTFDWLDKLTGGKLTDIWNWFKNISKSIDDTVDGMWKSVKDSFNNSLKWVSDIWNKTWGAISDFGKGIWNGISDFVGKFWGGMKSVFKSSGDDITNIWRNTWNSVSDFFKNIWDKIKKMASDGINGIINVLNSGISGINGVISTFGGSKNAIGRISPVRYATGTNNGALEHHTYAMLNDGHDSPETNNREMAILPTGQAFIPQERNWTGILPKGTEILNATETKNVMNMNNIQHFANGQHSDGAVENVKNIINNSNPTKFANGTHNNYLTTNNYANSELTSSSTRNRSINSINSSEISNINNSNIKRFANGQHSENSVSSITSLISNNQIKHFAEGTNNQSTNSSSDSLSNYQINKFNTNNKPFSISPISNEITSSTNGINNKEISNITNSNIRKFADGKHSDGILGGISNAVSNTVDTVQNVGGSVWGSIKSFGSNLEQGFKMATDIASDPSKYIKDLIKAPSVKGEVMQNLGLGMFDKAKDSATDFWNTTWSEIGGILSSGGGSGSMGEFLQYAIKNFSGRDYVYGGFDCSEMVREALEHFGINIGRTTVAQEASGKLQSLGGDIHNSKPGDLVYFGSSGADAHVGIVSDVNRKLMMNQHPLKGGVSQISGAEAKDGPGRYYHVKGLSSEENSGDKKESKGNSGLTKYVHSMFDNSMFKWIQEKLAPFGEDVDSGGVPGEAPKGDHKNWMKQAGIPESWFNGLNEIIQKESGWNPHIKNPGSDAYGIPQALPGSKMASAGSDWHDNPITQLKWMKSYIKDRYGDLNHALSFRHSHGWYANGGIVNNEQVAHIAEGNNKEVIIPIGDKAKRPRAIELLKETVKELDLTSKDSNTIFGDAVTNVASLNNANSNSSSSNVSNIYNSSITSGLNKIVDSISKSITNMLNSGSNNISNTNNLTSQDGSNIFGNSVTNVGDTFKKSINQISNLSNIFDNKSSISNSFGKLKDTFKLLKPTNQNNNDFISSDESKNSNSVNNTDNKKSSSSLFSNSDETSNLFSSKNTSKKISNNKRSGNVSVTMNPTINISLSGNADESIKDQIQKGVRQGMEQLLDELYSKLGVEL